MSAVDRMLQSCVVRRTTTIWRRPIRLSSTSLYASPSPRATATHRHRHLRCHRRRRPPSSSGRPRIPLAVRSPSNPSCRRNSAPVRLAPDSTTTPRSGPRDCTNSAAGNCRPEPRSPGPMATAKPEVHSAKMLRVPGVCRSSPHAAWMKYR